MNSVQVCVLASAAFAGNLSSYEPTARQKGWPVGSLFVAPAVVPTFLSLGVLALLLGAAGVWAYAGRVSWLWLLWVLLASFTGAAVIPSFLRSWSGAIALFAAPALAVAALVMGAPTS